MVNFHGRAGFFEVEIILHPFFGVVLKRKKDPVFWFVTQFLLKSLVGIKNV